MSRTLWVFALVDLVLSAFSNVLEEHEIDRGMHRWYHDWVPAFAWIQEWRHPTMKSATELEIEREESEVVEDYFDDEVAKKDDQGRTPLFHAVVRGHYDLVVYLCDFLDVEQIQAAELCS